MIDTVTLIPWGFTIFSILVAIYSLIKNNQRDDKKENADLVTVIAKLENIQRAVDKTSDVVTSIQNEMKSLDRRVTRMETKFELEDSDD